MKKGRKEGRKEGMEGRKECKEGMEGKKECKGLTDETKDKNKEEKK